VQMRVRTSEQVEGESGGTRVHQDEHGDMLCELGPHTADGQHGEAAVHEEHQVACDKGIMRSAPHASQCAGAFSKVDASSRDYSRS
jgi:hypothetical protein